MKHYPRLLLSVIVFAGLAGLGAGSFIRFSRATGASKIRLDPEQTFPAQADWPVTASETNFDQPFVAPDETYRRELRSAPLEPQPKDDFSTETNSWAKPLPDATAESAPDFPSSDATGTPLDSSETFSEDFMEDSTTSAPLNTQPSPWEESESGPETNRQNRDSSSNSGDLANSSGKVAPVSPGSEMLPSEMPTPTTDTR